MDDSKRQRLSTSSRPVLKLKCKCPLIELHLLRLIMETKTTPPAQREAEYVDWTHARGLELFKPRHILNKPFWGVTLFDFMPHYVHENLPIFHPVIVLISYDGRHTSQVALWMKPSSTLRLFNLSQLTTTTTVFVKLYNCCAEYIDQL